MRTYEEWTKDHQPFSKEFLLKEKLGRWAGLEPYNVYPTGYDWDNFTDSIDLCFYKLVPKLKEMGYMVRVQYSPLFDDDTGKKIFDWTGWAEIYNVEHIINKHHSREFARASTPALALCLAIEKFIDYEYMTKVEEIR